MYEITKQIKEENLLFRKFKYGFVNLFVIFIKMEGFN